jgi:hypothetical protein
MQLATHPREPTAPTSRRFRFEAWFLLAALIVGFVLTGWFAFDLETEQVLFLTIGSTAFLYAALVWRHGIIGYYHRTGFGEPPVTEVREAPIRRELLAPLLILVGIGFVLAGTPTGIGHVLSGSAHAAVMLYKFGQETYEIVLAASAWAVILSMYAVCIVRRDRELLPGLIVLTALFGLAGGLLYLSYRWNPGGYRQMWDDYVAPFRFVIGIFT